MALRRSMRALELAQRGPFFIDAGLLKRWRPHPHRASAEAFALGVPQPQPQQQRQNQQQQRRHRHTHAGFGKSDMHRHSSRWPLLTAGSMACGLGLAVGSPSAQTAQCLSFSSSSTAQVVAPALPLIVALERPVQLFQYDVCPFCNKAQAFMEANGVPYEKHEVNPLTKAEIAFSKYKMVPLAIINGVQVNGSATIIQALLDNKEAQAAAAAGKELSAAAEAEARWCSWVDDHLVHVLPPNIYRTPREAMQAFDYISSSSNFSATQQLCIRYAGAAIMFLVAKRAKKKYNLSEDPRQDLFDAIDTWAGEGLGGDAGTFHGGRALPGIADLAVFGVLRSIEGNYGTWTDLSEAPLKHKDAFWGWYNGVKVHVETNRNVVPNSEVSAPSPNPRSP